MCGLAGAFNFPSGSSGALLKMLELIQHRGPDDAGTFGDPARGFWFGSQRLSILDLSPRGGMPMLNEDGNVAVCQNGEIYNYPTLRRELESKGHRFVSSSDTEVIVHGYEEWRSGIFSRLRGMFAIAIYDKKAGKLLLARDRIGIKPLYYYVHEGTVYFSSEIKSFLALPRDIFRREIDLEMVNILLGFMFLPDNEKTVLKGVRKVHPGHYLEIFHDGISDVCYWDLRRSCVPHKGTLEKATDQLDQLLFQTVSSHLMADVPLGVLLSGGLDSSLIAAMIKKQTSEPVLTFTAKFDHKFDESGRAKKVARYLETQHQEIFIDTSKVNEKIEQFAWYLDDLTSFDGGLLTTKLLCREVKKQGVTVLLLGEGADEVFGGYSWFGLSQLPLSVFPQFARSAIYYYAISRNITFRPIFYYNFWHNLIRKIHCDDIFGTISAVELTRQLPNHLLMKVDKGSMAASVEARVPYLDHKIVEFAYSLPRSYKIKGRWVNLKESSEKYILREVARRYLPLTTVGQKKRGFMLPMRDVLDANLEKVKDYALQRNSVVGKLLSRSQLEQLFRPSPLMPLNMEREYLLWRIFLLEVWHKVYVNHPSV